GSDSDAEEEAETECDDEENKVCPLEGTSAARFISDSGGNGETGDRAGTDGEDDGEEGNAKESSKGRSALCLLESCSLFPLRRLVSSTFSASDASDLGDTATCTAQQRARNAHT